jgi:hypothetical protein
MLQALNVLVGSSQRVQATMQYDGAREERLVKLSGDEFSFGDSEQLAKATGFKVRLMLVPKSTATDAIAESHTGIVVDYSLIRFGEVSPWLEKPECRS